MGKSTLVSECDKVLLESEASEQIVYISSLIAGELPALQPVTGSCDSE